MGREEPVVPVKITGTVLAFAVDGLVKVFHDHGANRLRPLEVGVDVRDEHGEGLVP
jgi:hypothetical protein